MLVTTEDIKKAAEENAENYVERAQNISKQAFADGAKWALDLLEESWKRY